MHTTSHAFLLLLATGGALAEFLCGSTPEARAGQAYTVITQAEAEQNQCCISLPCKYDKGCWAEQMPPTFSATRVQAINRSDAKYVEEDLLLPAIAAGSPPLSAPPSNLTWYRIPIPLKKYAFLYEGVKRAFRHVMNAELKVVTPMDAFYIPDYDERYASDLVYEGEDPNQPPYWIHTDCENFRLCSKGFGFDPDDFTGDGGAFVLPLAIPSHTDYRDGHDTMPAALELYNMSLGFSPADVEGAVDGESGLFKPPNRQWMTPYRFNLGEIFMFNAFRWHSGHIPRKGGISPDLNPLHKRSVAVGFTAKHKDGYWVLFTMCKGTTSDKKYRVLEEEL